MNLDVWSRFTVVFGHKKRRNESHVLSYNSEFMFLVRIRVIQRPQRIWTKHSKSTISTWGLRKDPGNYLPLNLKDSMVEFYICNAGA